MTITEFIIELQDFRAEHGDLPVYIRDEGDHFVLVPENITKDKFPTTGGGAVSRCVIGI